MLSFQLWRLSLKRLLSFWNGLITICWMDTIIVAFLILWSLSFSQAEKSALVMGFGKSKSVSPLWVRESMENALRLRHSHMLYRGIHGKEGCCVFLDLATKTLSCVYFFQMVLRGSYFSVKYFHNSEKDFYSRTHKCQLWCFKPKKCLREQ